MHFFRLFRRRESPATRTEPRALPVEDALRQTGTGMPEAEHDMVLYEQHQCAEDLQGDRSILALIGSRPAVKQGGVRQALEHVNDGEDLMSSLHRQYCQALDNPLGPMAGAGWESPSESSGRYVRDKSGFPADSHRPDANQDSIETLLSGAQLLDHAFGPLGESDLGNLLESEPVPEILRLFAPPEYLASAFRWMASVPPTLARREHHSLGIDSPLPMPEVTLNGNSS
ncbi:TagK domain-containing protein [Trinickia violacea]|uniref:TagK domain-containing protein n=1 Tax=Trinickia violacea TaxID=2571746 RepID=A0A4P8J0U0_9BURK|nr:TagK domain-containing protein [Trinickia violacea]QCP54377.1 TagK domain-containing protein [Trinickia violacea]